MVVSEGDARRGCELKGSGMGTDITEQVCSNFLYFSLMPVIHSLWWQYGGKHLTSTDTSSGGGNICYIFASRCHFHICTQM